MSNIKTPEDIYAVYQKEIVPLMAEMYVYVEKDYREHSKDVADLFEIIARTGISVDLESDDANKAVWLITKIKIAAYSFIVEELRRKLDDYEKRCDWRQRDFEGIEKEYQELGARVSINLRKIRKTYGRYPKICEECLSIYEDTYSACIEMLRLIRGVVTKSAWLYPYSPFDVLRKPLAWFVSLFISVGGSYFINPRIHIFTEYIKQFWAK